MGTLAIEYDDQHVSIKYISSSETTELYYMDKHTEPEEIANMLYDILDDFSPSVNVVMEEV